MAFNYQEMAKTELSRHGITPDALVESHPGQLKRMALEHDMGEISFQSSVARQLAESAPGDEAGRMKAYAGALIEEATHSYPPKDEYFGVDVAGKMGDTLSLAILGGEISYPMGIDKNAITEKVAVAMVTVQPMSIQVVPEEFRTAEVYSEAIKNGGESALMYIDNEIKNPGVDYNDMSDIQRAVADAMDERASFESMVNEFANGNEEAFKLHEQLKSGELDVSEMSKHQMGMLAEINWEVEVTETFAGHPLDEAMSQSTPGDSSWMSGMERTATVEMESPGGLKLEFGIQTDSSNGYESVETLRDFYDCTVSVDNNCEALIAGQPIDPSDMAQLVHELRDNWEEHATQMLSEIPEQYEAIADRTFADLAIDNTLDVSRNEAGDLTVNFSVEDPYREVGVDFTMKAGDPESLTHVDQEPSEAGMSLAETYVAENQEMISNEVDSFKLQEVGLSNVEIDHEMIEGTQAHFVTFDNQGEPGSVGLDSETLKLDSSSHGYDKLSEAQVEVLSEKVGKLTEGMTPPMGVEMAERKAQELGELLDKKVEFENWGDSFTLYKGESAGNVSTMYFQGSYSSASELNQALDDKILEARESITFERDEPKQEVERERHEEEPERRGIRM
ncbi:hypothetical protein F3I62_18930 [Pseudomonas sp. R-28-1W-6]|uniref:hypothetical protein n=1 Tax=Pseudomonas sp. R-28-1W-6 TaxID=2650101 RepID=UPI0013663204|nr:hypothetical protein [Pseudomonas sp. R-28-1W-6]MWV14180.1 hypothetical protein [Pseudomonas sp. R-28-1W-6]